MHPVRMSMVFYIYNVVFSLFLDGTSIKKLSDTTIRRPYHESILAILTQSFGSVSLISETYSVEIFFSLDTIRSTLQSEHSRSPILHLFFHRFSLRLLLRFTHTNIRIHTVSQIYTVRRTLKPSSLWPLHPSELCFSVQL